MKKDEIIPGDIQRILFGQAPAEFLVEVVIRTIIMYTVLLVVVRLMGKRMGGQLTISEFAVMITLGAIVSPGMQMPQTGVLLGVMVLVCALLFQRGLNMAEYKSEKVEHLSQGTVSILVKNGVMNLGTMGKTKVSRQQLFSAIRRKNIYNLGEIDRVYLEACGLFTIYKKNDPAPGMALFPPADTSMSSFLQEQVTGKQVCANCGNLCTEEEAAAPCDVCNSQKWQQATITGSKQSKLNAA